jgi:hypothetical protein
MLSVSYAASLGKSSIRARQAHPAPHEGFASAAYCLAGAIGFDLLDEYDRLSSSKTNCAGGGQGLAEGLSFAA